VLGLTTTTKRYFSCRELTLGMRDRGERCGKHRVAGLPKLEGLCSRTGYLGCSGRRSAFGPSGRQWWDARPARRKTPLGEL